MKKYVGRIDTITEISDGPDSTSSTVKSDPEAVGATSAGASAAPVNTSTAELLRELARRFGLRYGRIEVVFHDGRPSPRVLIEHRIQQAIDDEDSASRPPIPRRGKP